MPTFGVPQITLEGSRDQILRGCKVGLTDSLALVIDRQMDKQKRVKLELTEKLNHKESKIGFHTKVWFK